MNENQTNNSRVKCPFCAELIQPDAKLCRFCRSDLSKTRNTTEHEQNKKPSGYIKAIILNLVCPGLAAWKLGYKKRGALLFLVIIGSALIYAGNIIPLLNKAISVAMRTGNTRTLLAIKQKTELNKWLDISFYAYIYSFIDLVFIIKADKSKSENKP